MTAKIRRSVNSSILLSCTEDFGEVRVGWYESLVSDFRILRKQSELQSKNSTDKNNVEKYFTSYLLLRGSEG